MASFKISLLLNFLSAGCVGRSRLKSAKAPLTFCCRNLSRWFENIFRPPPMTTTPALALRIPAVDDDVAFDDANGSKVVLDLCVEVLHFEPDFSFDPTTVSSSSSLLKPDKV